MAPRRGPAPRSSLMPRQFPASSRGCPSPLPERLWERPPVSEITAAMASTISPGDRPTAGYGSRCSLRNQASRARSAGGSCRLRSRGIRRGAGISTPTAESTSWSAIRPPGTGGCSLPRADRLRPRRLRGPGRRMSPGPTSSRVTSMATAAPTWPAAIRRPEPGRFLGELRPGSKPMSGGG